MKLGKTIILGLALSAPLSFSTHGAPEPATVAAFVLPAHEGGSFDSKAAPDRYLILDFFAPWCLGCQDAARTLKAEVAPRFADHPLDIWAINVDLGDDAALRRFQEATRLGDHLEDDHGALFESLGGQVLPLILFLGPARADGQRPILWRTDGFVGMDSLQSALMAEFGPPTESPVEATPETRSASQPLSFEAYSEAFWSDDFRLTTSGLRLTWPAQRWERRLALTWRHHDVDYLPAEGDFLAQETQLAEDQLQAAFRLRRQDDRLRLWTEVSAADGFNDYRSVWLAEYYRQNFEGFPEYVDETPWLASIAFGGSWDLRPGQTQVSAEVSYQYDRISPTYERIIPDSPREPIRTEVGPDALDTWSGRLSVDTLLSPSARLIAAIGVQETTERDLRTVGQLQLFWSPARHWASQANLLLTHEGDFEAAGLRLQVERSWGEAWAIGGFVRAYTDDGLRENIATISAEPPGLETIAGGCFVRQVTSWGGWRLGAGVYQTSYDELPATSFTFESLYADQTFLQLEGAIRFNF